VTRAAALAILLALAPGAATVDAAPASGLYGTVTKGPITPVCRAEVPCSGPAARLTLVFRRGTTAIARIRTTEAGRYRVRLAPGVYTVRTNAKPFGTIPAPARVRVDYNRFRRVNFAIDTGIR
jgi:hypothetical protein